MMSKLDKILNISQDVLFEFDEDGTYLNIWTSNEQLLAIPRLEMLGKKIRDVLPQKQALFYETKFKEVLASQESMEIIYTIDTPSGPTHFSGSIIPFNYAGDDTIILYAKDITLQKQTDLSLNNIEKVAKIGAWSLDINTSNKTWTEQVYRIHDLPVGSEIDEEKVLAFYEEDSRELILKAVKFCISDKKAFDIELRLTTLAGQKIVRATGYPIIDDQDNVLRLVGTFQDISEHIKITEELEVQKNRLNQIIEHTPAIIFQFNLSSEGVVTLPYISKNFETIFGRPAEDAMKDASIIMGNIHPDDTEEHQLLVEKSAANLSKFEWVGRIYDKNKEIKWVHAQSSPKKFEDGSILWDGILFDMTETKKQEHEIEEKEKSLNHQLKLASLGKLSAGIAHEINNPLAIVNNVLMRMEKQNNSAPSKNKELNTLIELALDASKRIETITKGLKFFSRADTAKHENFNISESVSTTIGLLNELYRSEIFKIEFVRSEEDHILFGNRGRIDQVLMNLVTNAIDSIRGKEEGKIIVNLSCDEDQCHLIVSDNGHGIPGEIKDKIFDPFFTTKDVGKGTGIGLSLVNSIVLEHNGKMNVESSDEGTTFISSFPKTKVFK